MPPLLAANGGAGESNPRLFHARKRAPTALQPHELCPLQALTPAAAAPLFHRRFSGASSAAAMPPARTARRLSDQPPCCLLLPFIEKLCCSRQIHKRLYVPRRTLSSQEGRQIFRPTWDNGTCLLSHFQAMWHRGPQATAATMPARQLAEHGWSRLKKGQSGAGYLPACRPYRPEALPPPPPARRPPRPG